MASRANGSVGGAGGGSKKRPRSTGGRNSSTPAATATGTESGVDATLEGPPTTMTDVDGGVSSQSLVPVSGEVGGVSGNSDVSELANVVPGADSTTLPSTAAVASTVPAIQPSTHSPLVPNARGGKQRKVAAHATAADTATAATAHTDEEPTDAATTATIEPHSASASASPIMSVSATTPPSTSYTPIPVAILMPKLPGGWKAGFVTQWYWDHHPHARQLFQDKPHLLPAWSPVFDKEKASEAVKDIITTVQNVEQAISGRNVIGEIDGKILKEVSPEQLATLSEVESAALLTGEGGKKYQVQLQNKDDARILFNSSEDGGLFRRLGLCPLLCDVFYLQTGGKRTLIGGAGGSRGNPFGHGKLMTKQTLKGVQPQCICTHFATPGNNVSVKEESAPISSASPPKMEPLDVSIAASTTPPQLNTPTRRNVTATAVVEESKQPFVSSSIPSGAADEEDTEMSDSTPAPPNLHVSTSAGSTSTSAPSSFLSPTMPTNGLGSIIRRAPPGSGSASTAAASVLRSPPASGSGSHLHTSKDAESSSNCANCVNWQKKYAKQREIIDNFKAQVIALIDEKSRWEAKWTDEKDLNIRLWEKTMLIQKQLRDMSRPLSVSLTQTMNRISTSAPSHYVAASPTQLIQAPQAQAPILTTQPLIHPAQHQLPPQSHPLQTQQPQPIAPVYAYNHPHGILPPPTQQQLAEQQQQLQSQQPLDYPPTYAHPGYHHLQPAESKELIDPMTGARTVEYYHPQEMQLQQLNQQLHSPHPYQQQSYQTQLLQQQQQQQHAAAAAAQAQQEQQQPMVQ